MFLLFALLQMTASFVYAEPNPSHEMTLREALDLARTTSPDLKVAQTKEIEAQSNIGIAKSYYYPTIAAQAIDSWGLAASNSALGIQGVMGSPFRSGLGAGVYVTQTLYDFGRTSNRIESYEHQMEGQKQDTEITRYKVNLAVIQAYFSCSLNRAQKEAWQQVENIADVVEHEVEHFVKTGQRSVVDRYLAKMQKQEATTAVADFASREVESQKRLAILIGLLPSKGNLICPTLGKDENFGLSTEDIINPLIARANADLRAGQAQLNATKAENMPTLVAMGSAGYLQDIRLVDVYNYSFGVGISLPIFEGYRIEDEVNRSSAHVQEKSFAVLATQQFLDDMNQQYNESINSSRIRLDHLSPELTLAKDAMDTAKKRYFSFQGDLLDVRAALTNLTRVTLDENDTRARFLINKESKEVLNGAR